MVFSQWIRRVIRRLMRPDVLRRMEVTGEAAPRCAGAKERGKPQVYVAETECRDFFHRLTGHWESMANEAVSAERRANSRVLVKINLNTADPYPASTDPAMLRALLEFLREAGYPNLQVGDCSSLSAVPTRKVAAKTGIFDAVAGLGDFVCFDEQPWLRVKTGLAVLPSVTLPRALYEADFLIHLSNMKTHSLADFSFGMKLGVGYMHPLERYALHKGDLQEKVAELAAAISPDLTLIDGRRAFVCGGPVKGRVEPAHILMAGRNSLAVDVEAYRRLYQLKQQCGCVEGFQEDPFSMRQFAHARDVGVGGTPWQGYDVVEI